MNFLEKDLEEIIYTTDGLKLAQRGLLLMGKKFRQFKIGNYGIADLVTIEKPMYIDHAKQHKRGCVTIYELKKGIIDHNAFFQAIKYVRGIKHYLGLKNKPPLENTEDFYYDDLFDFKIILIGDKIDTHSSFCYLTDFLDGFNHGNNLDEGISSLSLQLYTYHYDFDGIKFIQHSGYRLTNPNFNSK